MLLLLLICVSLGRPGSQMKLVENPEQNFNEEGRHWPHVKDFRTGSWVNLWKNPEKKMEWLGVNQKLCLLVFNFLDWLGVNQKLYLLQMSKWLQVNHFNKNLHKVWWLQVTHIKNLNFKFLWLQVTHFNKNLAFKFLVWLGVNQKLFLLQIERFRVNLHKTQWKNFQERLGVNQKLFHLFWERLRVIQETPFFAKRKVVGEPEKTLQLIRLGVLRKPCCCFLEILLVGGLPQTLGICFVQKHDERNPPFIMGILFIHYSYSIINYNSENNNKSLRNNNNNVEEREVWGLCLVIIVCLINIVTWIARSAEREFLSIIKYIKEKEDFNLIFKFNNNSNNNNIIFKKIDNKELINIKVWSMVRGQQNWSVSKNDLVLNLKGSLADHFLVEVKDIRLLVNGKVMSNNKSLKDYSIDENSKIIVLLALKGGSTQTSRTTRNSKSGSLEEKGDK